MKLNLTVNGKLISSVPVDASLIENENYLKAFRRLLMLRHRKLLMNLSSEPVFYLEVPTPNKRAWLN
jgi:hypothetical protein